MQEAGQPSYVDVAAFEMGQLMKKDILNLLLAGFLEHLHWQEQTGPDETKKCRTLDFFARYKANDRLDAYPLFTL
ncbi:unnamed protein product, partial [marine sediment metagenome]